jgi:hypothetical protein
MFMSMINLVVPCSVATHIFINDRCLSLDLLAEGGSVEASADGVQQPRKQIPAKETIGDLLSFFDATSTGNGEANDLKNSQ